MIKLVFGVVAIALLVAGFISNKLLLFLMIPLFLMYLFASDNTPPQHNPLLKSEGGRGAFLDKWLSIRPLYESFLREAEKRKKERHEKP